MAERVPKNKPFLVSEGELSNPTSGTLVADSGAISQAGNYEFRIYPGATATAVFTVQRRNAANGANVGVTPTLYAAAGQTAGYVLSYSLEAGERVRVLMGANLTGNACVTINYEKLG